MTQSWYLGMLPLHQGKNITTVEIMLSATTTGFCHVCITPQSISSLVQYFETQFETPVLQTIIDELESFKFEVTATEDIDRLQNKVDDEELSQSTSEALRRAILERLFSKSLVDSMLALHRSNDVNRNTHDAQRETTIIDDAPGDEYLLASIPDISSGTALPIFGRVVSDEGNETLEFQLTTRSVKAVGSAIYALLQPFGACDLDPVAIGQGIANTKIICTNPWAREALSYTENLSEWTTATTIKTLHWCAFTPTLLQLLNHKDGLLASDGTDTQVEDLIYTSLESTKIVTATLSRLSEGIELTQNSLQQMMAGVASVPWVPAYFVWTGLEHAWLQLNPLLATLETDRENYRRLGEAITDRIQRLRKVS